MKRKNNILLISIPLGVLLLLYYGYIALDTWLQFQIRTGNGISAANGEWILSIQYTFLFILKWFGPVLLVVCLYGILKWLKKNESRKSSRISKIIVDPGAYLEETI